MKHSAKRSILSMLGALAAMALVLAFAFRGHGREILRDLRAVPPQGLAALPLMALGCVVPEAAALRHALRERLPGFSLWRAMTVVFLGVFGNTATFGVGSIPMQSWYLHRCGLPPGAGVSLLTLCYAMQKGAGLFYAGALLLVGGGRLGAMGPELSRYILIGCLVCALIVAALLLFCTWGRVRQLALWGIGKLPDKGSWRKRKRDWAANVEALGAQSKALLADRGRCGGMLFLYFVKLLLLCAVPYWCAGLLGLEGPGFFQTQLLSAVMLLIAGVMPNVGGVGPVEFTFLLLFSPGLGRVGASSAMVLYRLASYILPFLLSIPFASRLGRGAAHASRRDVGASGGASAYP